MVGWIPTPHVEARTTQRGAVQRPEVKDEHVPWSAAAPGYSPRTTEFPLPWKTGEQGSDWTAALQKSFQPGGTCRLALLNPGGRTGLVGGWSATARAGANWAVDPIITRFKPGAEETLQLLAYLRRDCNAWALPGAKVKKDESDEDAMRRGLAQKGGYTDDSRNSDDAWIETTVYTFHLEDAPDTTSSPGVKWVDISGAGGVSIFTPHRIWVKRVADEILQAPKLEKAMRAVTLRLLFRPLTLSLEAVRLAQGSFVGVDALGSALLVSEEQSRAQAIDASSAISSVTHVELRLGSDYCSLRPELMAKLMAQVSGVRQSDEGVKWVRCRCAPFAPIVVGWESRNRLSIPQDATHQAFVYGPLNATMVEGGYPDPQTEPFERLLVNGGFVYVSYDGLVLRVTHVDDVKEKDLYSENHVVEFKGPHRMEEKVRSFHAEEHHWTPVTLPFLRGMGAEHFMWLNPGEYAGTHPIKFGAFAYSAVAADDDGSAGAVYFFLKSEGNLRGATAAVDLDLAGIKAPVKVARERSSMGGFGVCPWEASQKSNAAAAAAAADAAAYNWKMFHDAVAMGDASLVESLIDDDQLLPEEMVESQLTKHKAPSAPCRTGILSRSFSPAEQSPRAAGEINRLDVPADSSSLTPLMMAAKFGHCDVVRTLLLRGASPMAQAQDGSTAIDFALLDDELSVEQLLHKLDAAIALLPALFRHSAGEALCYVTKIATRAHNDRERRERSSPADAEELQARADRAEFLGIELFKTLSAMQRTILLEREPCRATTIPEVSKAKVGRPRGFVACAVDTPRQQTLLGDPTVQAAVNFRWYGPLIDSVLNGYVVTPNGDEEQVRRPLARAGLLLLAAAVNLLFLPFVALWPPLRGKLIRFLDFGFELVSPDSTPYSAGFERKWSPTSQLYARSLYLLDEPFFQFAISTFSWLLLSLVLTLMPADAWAPLLSEGLEGMAPALATVAEEVGSLALSAPLLLGLHLWLLAHLIDEVETFSSNDLIKKTELSGISLALCSKLAPVYDRQMLSFGLLLMWFSWFMRIFSLNEQMGTLTVMLVKMLSDTVQFLFFMAGCAVAFAAALHQLFLGRDILDVEGCDKFGDLGEGLPLALKRLLLVAIDPGGSIDCASSIAESLNEFYYSAPLIVSVYVIMSVVLLLNMLIAIMAKTFDDVWDKADDENRYLKAQLAVQYFGEFYDCERYCTPPPPFNLLRLFSTLFSTLVDPGVRELRRRLWAKTREACELVGSFCTGAGSWLLWFICLPRLAVWVLQRAWANPYRNHAPPEEGLLSSEGESTDRYGLDPSNVRYVDGVGHLWSERNTVEKLMELEEVAKARAAAEAAGVKYTGRAGQTQKA